MHRAPLLALLLPLLAAAAMTPVITFQNEAGVAPEEMASIERDFRGWAARVYAYHEATPAPVTEEEGAEPEAGAGQHRG